MNIQYNYVMSRMGNTALLTLGKCLKSDSYAFNKRGNHSVLTHHLFDFMTEKSSKSCV